MQNYEYKVLPAPAKGEKSKGLKNAETRFAYAIERLMNDMAAEGWEYQRAETLPSEERSGLTSSQTVWRNLLVFRRPRASAEAALDDSGLERRRLTSAADLARTNAPEEAEPEAPEEAPRPEPVAETEAETETARPEDDDRQPERATTS
ncbi:MAG: hypothetical protein CMP09_12575 [Yangia sp.]|nr:hypothetical protein [Salipiger sp.]